MIELKEISIIEALVVTEYTGYHVRRKELRVAASLLDPTTHSVVPVPGEFTPTPPAAADLGREWVTGPIPARFVAIYQPDHALFISGFAALGTAYCVVIQHLVEDGAIPKYEPIVIKAN